MSNKLRPTGDNVVLQIVEQQMTAGGLHIPEKARTNARDAVLGKVLAVGPGRMSEAGATIMPDVAAGYMVLIARGAGVSVDHDSGASLRILRSSEILSIVEESRLVGLS